MSLEKTQYSLTALAENLNSVPTLIQASSQLPVTPVPSSWCP